MEYMKDPGWQFLRQSDDERMKDQSKPYDSKTDCWVPDAEEGFKAGKITGTKGDEVTVETAPGQAVTVKKDLIQEMNPPKFEKTEDMSNLSFLNDASVLYNLRARYSHMLIYTYSGLFCVVINPYKRLPIYTDSVARMYMGKRKNEMPPHLWANADEAWRNMMQDHENQSMLITGESGAGKTENTKKVIAYFAFLGQAQAEAMGIKKDDGNKEGGKASLEDQIVQTNPVLEAFGNAKTVRNNNSSRFGKFIRIHFSKEGRVAGCDIEHYLLEKSRVIRQAPGERCYHIFYQIFTDGGLRDKLQLDRDIAEYHFVAQAELTIAGVDDKEEFGLTDEAFDILNFTKDEKFDCYRLMAAQMHMGEMKFRQKPRAENAELEEESEAKKAADMFGVDWEALVKSMVAPRVRVGKEWVNKGQNLEQVNWSIGAMTKGMYNRVFNWLVYKCNLTLDAKEIPRKHFIGVLDIAGFEIFDFNSFEQLWINFVNEKLQQFFNHHMFVLEQEEYKREGIQWTFIDFGLDLAACIELIEKPMGVISMLDEECIVPKATDQTLAQKLIDAHVGKHPSMEKPKPPKGKQAEAHFAMKHYAGLVRYNVSNWLEKNKDPLNDTTVSVMKSGTNDLLLTIWDDYTTQEEQMKKDAADGGKGGGKKKGKSASMMTVSMLYRESLNNLMTMLNATHPHFVRCLIPNEQKKSGMLEAGLVMNQLTCNGVLEGIRICRKGFPNRIQHPEFKFRYKILAPEEAKSNEDPKAAARAILTKIVSQKKLEEDNFRVGETKVFFKAGILAHMEDLRDETLAAIMVGLQSYSRWFIGGIEKKRRQEQMAARKTINKNVKSWCLLRTWEWFVLLGKTKPLIAQAKEGAKLDILKAKVAEMEGVLNEQETARKDLEEKNAAMEQALNEAEAELEKLGGSETEAQLKEFTKKKEEQEAQLADLKTRQSRAEEGGSDLKKAKARMDAEKEDLKKKIRDLEANLKRVESDRAQKDSLLRQLDSDRSLQVEGLERLQKEHAHQAELNSKLKADAAAASDRADGLAKEKAAMARKVDDMEGSSERERRDRFDVERENAQLESKLRTALDKIDQLQRNFLELEHRSKMKEQELMSVFSRLKDESVQSQRLEQQVTDVGNTLHQWRQSIASRY